MKRLLKGALLVLVVFLLVVPLLATACGKEEVTPTSTPAPTSTNVSTPTATNVSTPTPTQSTATPTPTQTGVAAVEVPIGVAAMTTGSLAASGTNAARIVELTIEDINKTGFMVGNTLCKFKLIMDDYAYDSAKAISVVRKHILQDKVKFEFALGAPAVVAGQPYTEDAGVLLMEGATGSAVGPNYPLSFNPAGAYEAFYPLDYRYLRERFPTLNKVYYASIDLELTRTNFRVVASPILRYLGYDIVGSEFYPSTTTDFYPIIDRILAAKPDIVLDAANQVFTKQLRDRGYKGIIDENGTVVAQTFAAFVGGPPNTDLIFYPAINEHSLTLPAAAVDFIARYNAKYGEYPQGGSLYVLTALYSLSQAMTLAGTYTDTQKVAKALETGTFTSPLGTIKYGGADIFGVNHLAGPPCIFNEFINGVATEVRVSTSAEGLALMQQIYAAAGGRPK